VLSCATPLASWDHSTGDQGLNTFFKVMGILAHIPGWRVGLVHSE
jgi:hypothetical protein